MQILRTWLVEAKAALSMAPAVMLSGRTGDFSCFISIKMSKALSVDPDRTHAVIRALYTALSGFIFWKRSHTEEQGDQQRLAQDCARNLSTA